MDEYLGLIKLFAGQSAPDGYLFCEGQELTINSNMALYALLGQRYGGDGRTTFRLPDLRGRMVVGSGIGRAIPGDNSSPPLKYRQNGDQGGIKEVTLDEKQIPSHTHKFNAITGNRESSSPANNFLGKTASDFYASKGASDQLKTMAPDAIDKAGGGQPHNNMPPSLCLNYIICVAGIFPPKSDA